MLHTPKTRRRPVFESMEPRVLMAADGLTAVADLSRTAYSQTVGLVAVASTTQAELAAQTQAAQGQSGTQTTAQHDSRLELVVVDASIDAQDQLALLADVQAQREAGRQIQVVQLQSQRDPIAQISLALAAQDQAVAALHVVSHGQDGTLQLGATTLDAAHLGAYREALQSWSTYLTDDADLMLYGCDLAANDAGRALMQTLADWTGADVAASDDATGSAVDAADWTLEAQVGQVQATVAVTEQAQQAWLEPLATATDIVRETLVNPPTAANVETTASGVRGSQRAVAVADNGTSVVVWTDSAGVWAQRFDSTGVAIETAPMLVSAATVSAPVRNASVAMDSNSNGSVFAVVWERGSGLNIHISSQLYKAGTGSSAGTVVKDGAEIAITSESNTVNIHPSIDMASDGKYVIVWNAPTSGIMAQRLDDKGKRGSAVVIDDRPVAGNPAVTMESKGDFWVAYDASGMQLLLTKFKDDGKVDNGVNSGDPLVVTQRSVRDVLKPAYAPALTFIDPGGSSKDRVAVTWQSPDETDIFQATYKLDGTVGLEATQVYSAAANQTVRSPSISASTSSGDYVITWEASTSADGGNIMARRYNADGTPITTNGAAFQINSTTTGSQRYASVAVLALDDFRVVWSGEGVGDAEGVFVRAIKQGVVTIADGAYAVRGMTLTVPAAQGVLANDVDLSGANAQKISDQAGTVALQAQTLTTTLGNEVSLNPDGSFTYTRVALDASGTDSFSYYATTGTRGDAVNQAQVTLNVPAGPKLTRSTAAAIALNEDQALTWTSNLTLSQAEADRHVTLVVQSVYPGSATIPSGSVTVPATTGVQQNQTHEGRVVLDGKLADVHKAIASLALQAPAGYVGTGRLKLSVTDDNALSDSLDLVITVEEQPDALSFDAPLGNSSVNPVDVVENQSFALDLTVTDPDALTMRTNTPLNWRLVAPPTGSNDNGLFTLSPSTGRLAFNGVPDFEARKDNPLLRVDVQVDDNMAGSGAVRTSTLWLRLVDASDTLTVTSPADVTLNNVEAGRDITALTSDSRSNLTLRQAIAIANNTPGEQQIRFAANVQKIELVDVLTITDTINIAGTTNAARRNLLPGLIQGSSTEEVGSNASIAVELTRSATTSNAYHGLVIDGAQASGSVISDLSITRFNGYGVLINSSSNNRIEGNWIGLTPTGTVAGNRDGGVAVQGLTVGQTTQGNILGGITAAARNVISGNTGVGIDLIGTTVRQTTVFGNLIGGSPSNPSLDLPNNGDAIRVRGGAANNVIGGLGAGEANLLAVGTHTGVAVNNGGATGTAGNAIRGNWLRGTSGMQLIDLYVAGATGPNPLNAQVDVNAENLRVVAPTLTSVSLSQGVLTIVGNVAGAPLSNYVGAPVDLYQLDTQGNVIRVLPISDAVKAGGVIEITRDLTSNPALIAALANNPRLAATVSLPDPGAANPATATLSTSELSAVQEVVTPPSIIVPWGESLTVNTGAWVPLSLPVTSGLPVPQRTLRVADDGLGLLTIALNVPTGQGLLSTDSLGAGAQNGLTKTDTVARLNDWLASLHYQSAAGQTASPTLSMTVSDVQGGFQTQTTELKINLGPNFDLPERTVSVNETLLNIANLQVADRAGQGLTFQFIGVDGSANDIDPIFEVHSPDKNTYTLAFRNTVDADVADAQLNYTVVVQARDQFGATARQTIHVQVIDVDRNEIVITSLDDSRSIYDGLSADQGGGMEWLYARQAAGTTITLRDALEAANRTQSSEFTGALPIRFNVPGSAPDAAVIRLTKDLPEIQREIALQGRSWDDATQRPAASPRIVLQAAPTSARGLVLGVATGHSIVQGLELRGFGDAGLEVRSSNNLIRDNVISGNGGSGLLVAAMQAPDSSWLPSLDNLIVSNLIENNGGWGVQFVGQTSSHTLTNNEIINNGGGGIGIAGAASRIEVQANNQILQDNPLAKAISLETGLANAGVLTPTLSRVVREGSGWLLEGVVRPSGAAAAYVSPYAVGGMTPGKVQIVVSRGVDTETGQLFGLVGVADVQSDGSFSLTVQQAVEGLDDPPVFAAYLLVGQNTSEFSVNQAEQHRPELDVSSLADALPLREGTPLQLDFVTLSDLDGDASSVEFTVSLGSFDLSVLRNMVTSLDVIDSSTAFTVLDAVQVNLFNDGRTIRLALLDDDFALQEDLLAAVQAVIYVPPSEIDPSANVFVAFSGTLTDRSGLQVSTDPNTSLPILPINDPPVLTVTQVDGSPVASGATLTFVENTLVVASVAASDVDLLPGTTLSFALEGTDATAFGWMIDPNTGARSLVFKPPVDAEAAGAKTQYEVRIRVSDGSASSTSDLTIRVTDLDETPLRFNTEAYRSATATAPVVFAINEGRYPIATLLGDFAAVDPDVSARNLAMTYQLLNQDGTPVEPNSLFMVDSSGKLMVRAGAELDFETMAAWSGTVRATLGNGAVVNAPVRINLISQDDNPISTVSNVATGATLRLSEVAPDGASVGLTVLATDADIGRSNGEQRPMQIEYAIASATYGTQDVSANFSVNAQGVVSYRGGIVGLDFDQGAKTIALQVRATSTDPTGVLAQTSQTGDFVIALTNADDNPVNVAVDPRFANNTVAELRVDADRRLMTINVSDLDRPELTASQFSYELEKASTSLPDWLEVSADGVVSVREWEALDAENTDLVNGVYGFAIRVLDENKATVSLTKHELRVVDVDEADTVINARENLLALPAVPETAEVGALTGIRFTLIDPDVSAVPGQAWIVDAAGNPVQDGAFKIVPLSDFPGTFQLVVNDPSKLDHDAQPPGWDGRLQVRVMASHRFNADGTLSADARPAERVFQVRIADQDDHGVGAIENQAVGAASRALEVSVRENDPGEIAGFLLGASREDRVDGIAGFAVLGDARTWFDINDQGRLVARGTGLDYEAWAADNYQINVPVEVRFSDGKSANVTIAVQVRNANEAPTLQMSAVNNAQLDLANSAWTLPMLTADPNAQIVLSGTDPENDTLEYRVTGLPAGIEFDAATRSLRVSRPDLLMPGSTDVTIRVSDGAAVTTSTLTITATLPSAWTPSLTMQEDETRSVAVRDLFAAALRQAPFDTLRLTDSSGAAVQRLTVMQGGVAVAEVSVQRDNTLTVTPVANFNGRLTVPIQAATSPTSRIWLTGELTVNVTPVNDLPQASAQAFTVYAGQGSGSALAQLTASDVDVGAGLRYAVRSADGSAPMVGIEVNRLNGRVQVTDAALLASARTLSFQIQVSDGVAAQPVVVPVTVNVAAPLALTVATAEDQSVRIDDRLNAYLTERRLSLATAMSDTLGTLGQIATVGGQAWLKPAADVSGGAVWNFQALNQRGEAVPGVLTVEVAAVNDLPVSIAPVRRALSGSSIVTLQAADFPFSDIENNALQGVRITSLPAGGTLLLASRPVVAGTVVSAAQLRDGQLTYQASAFSASSNFGYRLTDVTGATDVDWSGGQQMWFDVRAVDTAAVVISTPSSTMDAPGGGAGANASSVSVATQVSSAVSTSSTTSASTGSSGASTGNGSSINPSSGVVAATGVTSNALLASASGSSQGGSNTGANSGSSAAPKQSGSPRSDGDGFVVNPTSTAASAGAAIDTQHFQIASLASELSVGKLLAASGSAQVGSALKPVHQEAMLGVALHPGLSLLSSNLQSSLTQPQGWSPASISVQAVPKESSSSRSSGLTTYRSQAAYQQMDLLRHNVSEKAATTRINSVVSSVAVSGSMSVGYVIWLLRGGVLASTMFSSMPAWRTIDPLPVLSRSAEDDDGESLESLVAGGEGAGEPDAGGGMLAAMPWMSRAASALGWGARPA